jgi:hypothetical protein
LGDALVDLVQEPRVADLISHGLAGSLAGAFAVHCRRLRWFLGALPGVPGFPFQEIDLLQFQFAGVVEGPHARLAPLLPTLLEVL